ncbi:MAG: hypothetical protein LBQ14_08950 [Treponema sp.]|jgi:hypothetical protein|nr:hypothetical protein [Treponema sp.]
MKKISLRLIFLSLPFFIFLLVPLPENSYNLAIADKHRLLQTEKAKFVLAGGSNLSFGIDSGALEDAFNVSVVNMGINAGFGLGRILDDISPFLNTGDILLIVPEYAHFTTLWNGNGIAYEAIFDARQYQLLWHPGYYDMPIDCFNYLSTKYEAVKYFLTPQASRNPNVYYRDGFNKYGDYIKHLKNNNGKVLINNDIGDITRQYIQYFFRFIDDFNARGITVLLSYPSYESNSFVNNEKLIRELDMLFRKKEGLVVISKPEDYSYPKDFFYDTVYHLNAKGRKMRTDNLITDIKTSGILVPSFP